jgi:neopullulanase
MHFRLLIILGIITTQSLAGQITRLDPPNWWVGMKYDTVQLMLYGNDFAGLKVISDSPSLEILNVYVPENQQYGFVDIYISPNTKPGKYPLQINTSNNQPEKIDFQLNNRSSANKRYAGFDCSDIIYLITPDRFVNGDPDNDYNADMIEEHAGDRAEMLRRSGGDIDGIVSKLDYIKDLGFTAIWINPLTENNMPISYHGYGVTDLYRIDPRFGKNQSYYYLVNEAHKRDIKIIMDHVSNHIGIYHPWMQLLPESSWINGTVQNHKQNHHYKSALFDPHADSLDIDNVMNAWFVDEMPDLNQKNEQVAKYLIQNTIWWIESAGVDGIREDTYPYADPAYLAEWADVVLREYPDFNIVGEVWIQDPVFLAPFQAKSKISNGFNTKLPSVTDFGLFEAFGRVFNRDGNISEFYSFLAKDLLYPDANNLVTFIDNHDVMRLMDLVHNDVDRYVMALKMLLTMRGIPQIYYGTEIGLPGGKYHAEIRRNFPGGFPGDIRNAFSEEGRTDQENYIFAKLKALLQIRRRNQALTCGSMTHLSPQNNFYVYIREHMNNKLLMIANNDDSERYYNLKGVSHHFKGCKKLRNVELNIEFDISATSELMVPANDVLILELIN